VTVGQLVVREPATMAGVNYALGNQITIGRASTCGIHLDDGYVSQIHARVFATNDGFHLEDLESSNGTTLNGQAVRQTTKLAPGDLIKVGATVMEFS
jgi:pSer/pThr/pTyr-binding forkhead associated (FHA) protein